MQKTLGGDRLGSGKKMKVDLHGYERSTHNLGYLWRSTMSAGTLVPFLSEVALPGDTFDIDLNCDIKTHPTIGPLFGSYKVQLDVFLAPIRLYHSALHNNALNIGRNMANVKLPQLQLKAKSITDLTTIEDLDNVQVNPSCILSYLGIRGIGLNTDETDQTRNFCAIPLLAYWEIYKNYYANKQEEKGAVIHTPSTTLVNTVDTIRIKFPLAAGDLVPLSPAIGSIPMQNGHLIRVGFTGTQPIPAQIMLNIQGLGIKSLEELATNWTLVAAGILEGKYNYNNFGAQVAINWRMALPTDGYNGSPTIFLFNLDQIDSMRTEVLSNSPSAQLLLSSTSAEPYKFLFQEPAGTPNIQKTQEGLAIKTYQSDLLNNWISTEWIDGTGGISEITSIDTSGGSFSIDTLILSRKVYNMLNRIAVSGGSYDDWLDAVYTHDRYTRVESPMYMGGLIKELVFQEVVSNSASEGTTDQPLGTLAGKGVMANKHKGGGVIIKVDEPSWILGIISLTPRVDYSQGNKWDVHLNTMDDLHKPALDEIGFQELITEQMAWWDTTYDSTSNTWIQKSAGKQPAWLNYMTNINQTRGNFAVASNEMFMTLNRRYEKGSSGIEDLTTYIDPSKFNFIFANTALDSQNFWAQIAVDITARRKMSAKIMPNL